MYYSYCWFLTMGFVQNMITGNKLNKLARVPVGSSI